MPLNLLDLLIRLNVGLFARYFEKHQERERETSIKRWIDCVSSANTVQRMEFMYLVFTCMPGDSYRRRFSSLLLCLDYVFRALINSLVVSGSFG